jgi:hypothetical protein
MTTLTIDGQTIELHDDGAGLVGHAEIDGRPVVAHVTVTPTGRRTLTPAKWCATR